MGELAPGQESFPTFQIVGQSINARRMQRNQAGLTELGGSYREDPFNEVNSKAVLGVATGSEDPVQRPIDGSGLAGHVEVAGRELTVPVAKEITHPNAQARQAEA